MTCKPKCRYVGYHYPVLGTNVGKTSDGRVGKKAMEAIEGNDRFEPGTMHPQCDDCFREEQRSQKFIDETLQRMFSKNFDDQIHRARVEADLILEKIRLEDPECYERITRRQN